MADEFVTISDLRKTYTTSTHPTLAIMQKFIIAANEILMAWRNNNSSVSITGAFKQVGIQLVQNMEHNEKVRDQIEGYQYYKSETLTLEMKDLLLQGNVGFGTGFSFNPNSNGTFI